MLHEVVEPYVHLHIKGYEWNIRVILQYIEQLSIHKISQTKEIQKNYGFA